MLIAPQYIIPRFGRLFRSDGVGDLGHLADRDDNATKEWYPLSEESSCNTLIALLRVKPLAWLELTGESPFRVLTGEVSRRRRSQELSMRG